VAAPVTLQKHRELADRMKALGIEKSDLEETFIRAGGPGGQKVNKSSVAVRLIHRPSGLEVRCQQNRSQAINRFLARRRLVAKLEAKIHGEKSEEQKRIEKIRRQKRKRSKRAKEKMLVEKRHRSETKALRKSPSVEDVH